jgi:ribosomal protein S18 acetylase RimI-like enzyme
MIEPSDLIAEDWSEAPAAVTRALYDAEIERWGHALEWDTATNWAEVERGRRLRTVRGWLARDRAGTVQGWTFYLQQGNSLSIGGFVSSSDVCTTLLLDCTFNDAAMAEIDTVTFFAFADVEGLAPALKRRGLTAGRSWYLGRSIPMQGVMDWPRTTRGWRLDDVDATASLLERAYGRSDGSRPFAPRGTRREWLQYVSRLAQTNGCGTLLADASLCVPAGPGRLTAVALVSRISPGTAHLVQLVVDPSAQRRGHGAALLSGCCRAAARAGCRRMTLLVDGRNTVARGLYDAAGFEVLGSFVAAGALQPLRSTSMAADPRLATFR